MFSFLQKSVDQIVFDISVKVKELRAARDAHLESASSAREEAVALQKEADEHDAQADRAARVAFKIEELIA